MNLCKNKDLFGKPNTGLHSFRIFNIAIVDLFLTIFAAYLFSVVFKFSFLYSFAVLFILGIILHHIFCVKTTIDKLIFG